MEIVDDQDADEKASALYKLWNLSPVIAALAYPFVLSWFNTTVNDFGRYKSSEINFPAVFSLLVAFAIPAFGLFMAWNLSQTDRPTAFGLRARRLAYSSIIAPPVFVFFGVALGLLGSPVSDTTVWICVWAAALAFSWNAGHGNAPAADTIDARLRVAHGAIAVLLATFFLFHLFNHLIGLLGPAMHAEVMSAGREIYRAAWIEPIFLLLLALQIAIGLRLALRWSARSGDIFRVMQIGSGIYIGAFIIAHLNSALVSSRMIRGIETDWAWASGAPEGLIFDAWNIRLLPHYALGAFFLLAHLATGARLVLLAHGVREAIVNRLWQAALVASGALASAIIGALIGLRA